MDLLQCVTPTYPEKSQRRNPVFRQVHSEEREVNKQNGLTPAAQRRISLPSGHYAASPSKIRAGIIMRQARQTAQGLGGKRGLRRSKMGKGVLQRFKKRKEGDTINKIKAKKPQKMASTA